MRPEWQLRREIVAIGRQLYARRLVAASDGNISVRLSRDRFLVTPSGACLGELKPQELVYVNGRRQQLGPALQPTSELAMHMTVYDQRPDVGAAIHAHPIAATALSIAGLSLEDPVLPEVVLHLGRIPTAPYATLATAESAAAISALIGEHDAIILERHGTLTVGADLTMALRNLEKLEHCAEVCLIAHRLGRLRTLSPDEVARLQLLREQLKAEGGSARGQPTHQGHPR